MTDVEQPELEVELLGKMVFVRFPRPEQILVWQRTVTKLKDADTDNWNGAQVIAALERTRKIIDSLIANPTDVEWLDDQMLDGKAGLPELSTFFLAVIDKFAEANGNRETRRAAAKAAPAKKAARKAPARKAGQQ